MSKLSKTQEEFAQWLSLPEARRGVWSTEEEWAAAHSVTTRTTRRWKTLDEFKSRLAVLSGDVPEPVEVEPSSQDESDYQAVKSRLVEGAKDGNAKSMELYFKTYGKPFVEEEVASRSVSFSDLELDQLVLEAIVALGPDVVAAHLRTMGFEVKPA